MNQPAGSGRDPVFGVLATSIDEDPAIMTLTWISL
jgi:hypothetical protein